VCCGRCDSCRALSRYLTFRCMSVGVSVGVRACVAKDVIHVGHFRVTCRIGACV